MKRLIFFLVVILNIGIVYSGIVSHNISFGLQYPIPIGDNFINGDYDTDLAEDYKGIINFELGYSFLNIKGFKVGFLYNTSILKYESSDLTLTTINPNLKIEYDMGLKKLNAIYHIALGYSNWRFRAPAQVFTFTNGDTYEMEAYKENRDGLTFKGAGMLVFNNDGKIKFQIKMCYEFTKLDKPNVGADVKFNRNIQMFYPGLGIIWNFGVE